MIWQNCIFFFWPRWHSRKYIYIPFLTVIGEAIPARAEPENNFQTEEENKNGMWYKICIVFFSSFFFLLINIFFSFDNININEKHPRSIVRRRDLWNDLFFNYLELQTTWAFVVYFDKSCIQYHQSWMSISKIRLSQIFYNVNTN